VQLDYRRPGEIDDAKDGHYAPRPYPRPRHLALIPIVQIVAIVAIASAIAFGLSELIECLKYQIGAGPGGD
jgi:hypothetical protein